MTKELPSWMKCNGCVKREQTIKENKLEYIETLDKIKKISFDANFGDSENPYEDACNKINREIIKLLKELKKK